jgi:uncharacterized protein YbcI
MANAWIKQNICMGKVLHEINTSIPKTRRDEVVCPCFEAGCIIVEAKFIIQLTNILSPKVGTDDE